MESFVLGMYFRSILYVHDKLLAEKMRIDDDSQEVLYVPLNKLSCKEYLAWLVPRLPVFWAGGLSS